MIDIDRIIEQQLSIRMPQPYELDDAAHTLLTPARSTPCIDEPKTKLSLGGPWQVKRWPWKMDEAKLADPNQSDARWDTAMQPGKVFYGDPDEQTAEVENWNRVTLAHLDEDDGAMLRRTIEIPQAWRDKRIRLRFDSIFPGGRIYCQGKMLGEQLSGLTPIEFDVTDLVKPGREALIAVRLLRKHRWVQLDMVRHSMEFAGLAQSAYLYAVEPCHVSDIDLPATLDRKCVKGQVQGRITLTNQARRDAKATATLELLDPRGKTVTRQTQKCSVKADATSSVDYQLEIEKPMLWSDESPTLYTLCLSIKTPQQDEQTLSWRVGFRRLDLSPKGPKLNNRFIKLRGVNHLTYHPEFGMHTPVPWLRRSLELMKKANVNTIRTHFLGPRALGDLCDEMGIYLLQELPIDWGTHFIHDPQWVGPAMTRLEAGIRRDRHHASIIVWSVGNENMPESQDVAEQGWHHLRIHEKFVNTLDPHRPTMFPPPGPANKIRGIFEVRVGDIADIHYSLKFARDIMNGKTIEIPNSWDTDLVQMDYEKARKMGHWSGVWFSSEWGIINLIPDVHNAPYASIISDHQEDVTGGLSTQQTFINRFHHDWGLMRHDPACLGGAYFPWICAASGADDQWGNPWGYVRWAEDADWGVMTADLTPKPQFWVMRTMYSPVWFPPRYVLKGDERELQFEVQNQFHTTDLADCTLRVQMRIGRHATMMRDYRDVPMRGKPGATVKLRVPLTDKVREALAEGQYGLCRLHLLRPDGFRVITHDMMLLPVKLAHEIDETLPVGPDADIH